MEVKLDRKTSPHADLFRLAEPSIARKDKFGSGGDGEPIRPLTNQE
jgi:hypothetical protein